MLNWRVEEVAIFLLELLCDFLAKGLSPNEAIYLASDWLNHASQPENLRSSQVELKQCNPNQLLLNSLNSLRLELSMIIRTSLSESFKQCTILKESS